MILILIAIPADANLLHGQAWIRIAWIRIGGIRVERIRIGGYASHGYVLVGYMLNGYVLVGYVLMGYVWNGYVWDMCGVMDMCGVCVGYVWCEIRQQSSEEPCDETSFGKNDMIF